LAAYKMGDANFNRRKGSIFVILLIGVTNTYSSHVEKKVVHGYSKKVPEW
jgi:hypothetical protein